MPIVAACECRPLPWATPNVTNLKLKDYIMPSITFYSLHAFNNGTLLAETFDLDILDDYELLSEARRSWLDGLTEGADDGELHEEYIVADYEGLPSSLVGEYDIDRNFGEWLELCEAVGEDVALAGANAGIPLEDIQEAYAGEHDTARAFAEHYIDSTGMLDDLHSFLSMYFDYDAFARDLMIDYTQEGKHFFRNF